MSKAKRGRPKQIRDSVPAGIDGDIQHTDVTVPEPIPAEPDLSAAAETEISDDDLVIPAEPDETPDSISVSYGVHNPDNCEPDPDFFSIEDIETEIVELVKLIPEKRERRLLLQRIMRTVLKRD